LALCAYAADVKEKEANAEVTQTKDKRQTQDEIVHADIIYRNPRKQEQVAPVEEQQEEGQIRTNEEYRPGQVFSLNAQELLELQPERKAPLSGDQLLQQLYTSPQQDHKQNLQQVFYLEPQQIGRQVSPYPSHAVIARPSYSSNGGEASVGAALSVSDSGASPSSSFDQELLALLGHQVTQEESRPQVYSQPQPIQQTSAPNLAPQQHQQVDRYIAKPTKKATKPRNKSQNTPQSAAPQQYLIETTNVPQQQAIQPIQQYRPIVQTQRPLQALRYVPLQQAQPAIQQVVYDRPESQGLKIVPAPKLQPLQLHQQPRQPIAYRIVPQYQPEATPKQYRIIDAPRLQPARQEPRAYASSAERPIAYLKRYPELEKMRAVKIYEPVELAPQQPAQILGEQYYVRPYYRQSEQRARYDLPVPLRSMEQARPVEMVKPPSSAIYVSKNLTPKKIRPQQSVKAEPVRFEQPTNSESTADAKSLDEQRAQLPPPKNNKAYTPEEFAALVAAGYSVTPIPVSSHVAQSRSSVETSEPVAPRRRPLYRRPQYLPIRDDAP
ncbi:hypothetical protein ACJJTC_004731, partial [Scirpophaga incertulas]